MTPATPSPPATRWRRKPSTTKPCDELDQTVGLKNVKAFHLNDSKGGFGSRKDRHENIGEGELGLGPFKRLLNDPRFQAVPMYLETPKGTRDDDELDAINLATLRDLVKKTQS